RASEVMAISSRCRRFQSVDLYYRVVIPNPASDLTTVAYYLPKGGKARLELRDLYGRPVWGRSLGLQEGGWYKEGIETSSLAQGLYYYTLSFEGRKLTKKLLISR
ncbi:MAG: T9SS type A sorting domain-containing protein, partial [Bacteroidota bacterium]